MVCVPTVRLEVAKAALPAESRATDPSDDEPSVNAMEPVGTDPPVEVTVAVNVTLWPSIEGFRLETALMVVLSGSSTV